MDERRRPDRPEPDELTEGVRIIDEDAAAEAVASGEAIDRTPRGELRPGDRPASAGPPEGARPTLRFPQPAQGLPHYADEPTQAVPQVSDEIDPDDDLDAWSSFATGAPRWRDQPSDWAAPDFDDASALGDDSTRLGALGRREERQEEFDFESPATPGLQAVDDAPDPDDGSSMGRNMPVAIAVGLGFFAVALFIFSQGAALTMVLATFVITMAAAELYRAFQSAGHQPATLVGLAAVPCLAGAVYWRGTEAYPIVLGLTVFVVFGWYLIGVSRQDPSTNAALTLLGVGYVGMLGSFAALLLRWPGGHGTGLLLGALLATIGYDVGGLFVGRRYGKSRLAPELSPNKTWEGLLGGLAASAFVCLVVVSQVGPWDFGAALALAVTASVAAPIGDLVESMLKRDLGVKDSGSLLPGHGGFLDRFDGLLFVLPATYYVASALDLGLV